MRIYHFIVNVTDNLVPAVILLDQYSCTVCVLRRAQEILSVHIPHRYWYIYENIIVNLVGYVGSANNNSLSIVI